MPLRTPNQESTALPESTTQNTRDKNQKTTPKSKRIHTPWEFRKCAPAGLQQALHKSNTAIIGDTLHFETLSVHELQGTTLGPASILSSLNSSEVYYHVWVAAKKTIESRTEEKDLTKTAMRQLLVELGNVILDRVPGPHFTFVDPRLYHDSSAIIRDASLLVSLFEESGVHRSNLVVSIPATEQGVAAAKELEKQHGVYTNLYLASGLLHAAACAEAGATSVTIHVGLTLDWYEAKRRSLFDDFHTHPGVETLQSILEYFRLHNIKSKVIGTDFRVLSEIGALAGFDAICVSRKQAEQLRWSKLPISAPNADSSRASLRARQAQYPTTLLASNSGFMTAMSPETRSMIAGTMYVSLGKLKAKMDILEQAVREEVESQFTLKTLDLRRLYQSTTPRSRKTCAKASTREEVHRGVAEEEEFF